MRFKPADWEPDFLHLTNVPIAHFVEVAEAHIVGVDVTDLLAPHFDITTDIVLCFEAVLSWLIIGHDIVSFVRKHDLACQLVTHVSHQHVEKVVTRVVVANCLAIFERDAFIASGG